MKNVLIKTFFVTLFFSLTSATIIPIGQSTLPEKSNYQVIKKEVEQLKGEKLTLKERIALKIFNKKLNKKNTQINLRPEKGNRKFHWSSIVALCCGVIALLTGFFGIPALVFGAIGLAKTGSNKKFKGLGFSIVGLVAGIIGVILLFAAVALFYV